MDDHDHNHDHDHEINNNIQDADAAENSNGGSGGTQLASSSRWTPTKEQINMLEGLYRQGIRTPSAEQIQQITSRLRAFGHIEGKNVFYWFQNHKARQRQKQKQETVAYINRHAVDHLNRFLQYDNRSSNTYNPLVVPSTASPHQYPCPNVVCGQYYVPIQTQTDPVVGTFHQQYHQNKPPIKTRPASLEKMSDKSRISSGGGSPGYNHVPQAGYTVDCGGGNSRIRTGSEMVNEKMMMMSNNSINQETLALFPLSPTGIFQGKNDHDDQEEKLYDHHLVSENIPMMSISRCYTDLCATSSGFEEDGCSSAGGGDRTFYDFFSR